MPSSSATTRGMRAELAAQRKFGLEGAGGPGAWDLRAKNGVVYQVKSTVHTRADGGPGRFRFERANFQELEQRRSGVILVLFPSVGSSSRRPLRVEKVPTSEVAEVVDDLGGWVRAGHASFSHQRRIEWRELVDY